MKLGGRGGWETIRIGIFRVESGGGRIETGIGRDMGEIRFKGKGSCNKGTVISYVAGWSGGDVGIDETGES